MTPRLSERTLADDGPLDAPDYERNGPTGIVHLGVGAFARAHLATYATSLIRNGWPGRIHGISLRSPRAEQALAPQDGLFTLIEREPDRQGELYLVGSITRVSTGADAAIEAIARPETRMVTLTVTEKAYVDRPHERGEPSVPEVIARGLDLRRPEDGVPVIASLDNVATNGRVLRGAVLAAALRVGGPGLADRIERHVPFPCSVVDRMVPAATAFDQAWVEGQIGLRDRAVVSAEEHRSWVIERVDGLPPLDAAGVTVVKDVSGHERRKLRLLNGPHSALAYAGLALGHDTIADALADPIASGLARRIGEDAIEVGPRAEADRGRRYLDESLRRFANRALGHTCRQVAIDGAQKLRQRIFPVAERRIRQGLDVRAQATVYACWLLADDDPPTRVEIALGPRRAEALVDAVVERRDALRSGPEALAEFA